MNKYHVYGFILLITAFVLVMLEVGEEITTAVAIGGVIWMSCAIVYDDVKELIAKSERRK